MDPVDPVHRAGRQRAAFERWREVIAAVPDDALVHINLDVLTTAMRALTAAKYIAPYRERAAMLPNFDIANFDRLEDYALAAMHAHTLYLAASPPTDELPAIKPRRMSCTRLAEFGNRYAIDIDRKRINRNTISIDSDVSSIAVNRFAGGIDGKGIRGNGFRVDFNRSRIAELGLNASGGEHCASAARTWSPDLHPTLSRRERAIAS